MCNLTHRLSKCAFSILNTRKVKQQNWIFLVISNWMRNIANNISSNTLWLNIYGLFGVSCTQKKTTKNKTNATNRNNKLNVYLVCFQMLMHSMCPWIWPFSLCLNKIKVQNRWCCNFKPNGWIVIYWDFCLGVAIFTAIYFHTT